MVQWLGLHVSNARGMGLILGQETKILQAKQYGQYNWNERLSGWAC